jgi:hypothetical protein
VTHAALEHAPLTVLAVHRVAASAWTGNPIIYPEDRPEAQKVLHAAEEAVGKTISELGDSRPGSVTVRGFIGQSGNALIEASHDADMVVVGARGGLARLMPGSVRAQRDMPGGRHLGTAVAARLYACCGRRPRTAAELAVLAEEADRIPCLQEQDHSGQVRPPASR